jgi:hypothetical protein
MGNSSESLNLKYSFYWKSNRDPFNNTEEDQWTPYDNKNQNLLNKGYENFLSNPSNDVVDLTGPSKIYFINFSMWMQISKLTHTLRPLKVEESIDIFNLDGNKIYPSEAFEENWLFFWNANQDPFNSNLEPKWSPYDLEDQKILKVAYENYLKDKSKSKYSLKPPSDYYVDFSRMYQTHKIDKSKIRPVQRCHPNSVSNVIRINRFNNSCTPDPIKINIIEKKEVGGEFNQFVSTIDDMEKDNKKKMNTVYFKVFENPINLEIDSNLSFFPDQFSINCSLAKIKEILIKEISDLGYIVGVEKSTKKYAEEIMLIKDELTFFQIIVRLYTTEGFLYKRLNEYLRSGLKDNYELIKYYYVSLLASFKYFSKETIQKFSNTTEDLIVYRGSLFFENELEEYEKNLNTHTLRIFSEFLSTTSNIKQVHNFFHKDDKSVKQFFWIIRIPVDLIKLEPYNFCDISNVSVFKQEKEVLLKSGAIISIDEIKPYTEGDNNVTFPNKYYKMCTLKSFSIQSLRSIVTFDKSITTLNLSFNYIGENEKIMLYLKEALEKNNSITTLNLSYNYIGLYEKAMLYLKEPLVKNKSIVRLDFTGNSFGTNEISMLYLKEVLEKNRSITTLILNNNSIGEKEGVMLHLKGALEKNKFIKSLHLNENLIGLHETTMLYLKQGLDKNTSITELDLGLDSIGENEEAMKYLKESLELNKSITTLFLNDNKIGDKTESMMLMKEIITKNCFITSLDLSYNSIGIIPNTVKYLKESLILNKSITNLNLVGNYIGKGEENLIHVKDSIKLNNSITNLNISANFIGENKNSVSLLIEALGKNNCLIKLDLTQNSINDNDMNKLRNSFKNISID